VNIEDEIFVPDGRSLADAFSRTTHLGVGAHQDDLEFMALHGILECVYSDTKWFGGIVCTDGAGSSRTGPYAEVSDDEMRAIRKREQCCAAQIGKFSFVAQVGFASGALSIPTTSPLVARLIELMGAMTPEVVYTHSPADKHETHIRVLAAVLEAIRQLPAERRPKRLLGCEGWRGLDWMNDGSKVVLDVSGNEHLAAALNGVFDSQIAGGKRYDLAVPGRRRANATLMDSHSGDAVSQAALAIDLTPLIGESPSEVLELTLRHVDDFRADVEARLKRSLG